MFTHEKIHIEKISMKKKNDPMILTNSLPLPFFFLVPNTTCPPGPGILLGGL